MAKAELMNIVSFTLLLCEVHVRVRVRQKSAPVCSVSGSVTMVTATRGDLTGSCTCSRRERKHTEKCLTGTCTGPAHSTQRGA